MREPAPDQIYIGQPRGHPNHRIKLTRAVAEAASGIALKGEDDLIDWAEQNMDAIVAAADRHRERDGPKELTWQELDVRDFAGA